MLLPFGRKQCALCGERVASSRALRVPDRMSGFVCQQCYSTWEVNGRVCAECQNAVLRAQEVGAFFERRALGHADCGGLKIFA